MVKIKYSSVLSHIIFNHTHKHDKWCTWWDTIKNNVEIYQLFFKRLHVRFCCICCFYPILIIITLALFFINNGNHFFFQKYSGKEEKPYNFIKCKTMNDIKNVVGYPLPDPHNL